MKQTLTVLGITCLLAGCAGFGNDYTVSESSDKSRPNWTTQAKAHKLALPDEDGKYRFFVDSADHINQRFCLKSAETRATQKIAATVAQELDADIKLHNPSFKKAAFNKMKEPLMQTVQVSLNGVSVAGKYWEKRMYKKELGAKKNYTAYQCNVAVKVKNTDLANAVEAYKEKNLPTLKGNDKKMMAAAVKRYLKTLKSPQ